MGETIPVHGDHTDRSRLTAEESRVEVGYAGRPFYEMRATGVLWAINRVLFHPRGYSLVLTVEHDTENVIGWTISGDGSEVIAFAEGDEDVEFAAFTALLDSLRRKADDE
jgi:hypothetical protein